MIFNYLNNIKIIFGVFFRYKNEVILKTPIMKKSIILLLLISNLLFGQKNYLGIDLGYNSIKFYDLHNKDLDNEFHNGNSFDFGIYYQSEIKENSFYSIGIDYTNISILLDYHFDGVIVEDISQKYRLISFPIEIQRDFKKYFYIRAGIIPHFLLNDFRNELFNFDGIGAKIEAGIKIAMDKLDFSLSPVMKMYSIVKFKEDPLDYFHYTIGLQLKTSYRF